MSPASCRTRTLALLLLSGAMVPDVAMADNAAVRTLIQQAQYWQSKGRADLANQALRRAAALDPGNAEVRRLQAGPPRPATPPPAPVQSAPVVQAARPAPAAQRVARRAAPAVAPAKPARDVAGQARVAGFAALQAGDLDAAQKSFATALARDRKDADALGGMGLVALKRGDFARARDSLEAASRLGDASKWAEALGSARFYGGIGDAQGLIARGRYDEARTIAEGLVRNGGGDPQAALELLAGIYEKQGRPADAADLYRQAAEAAKAGPDGERDAAAQRRLTARAARGQALAAAAAGDDLGAEAAFQQGLMLDPDDPWIRYEFARFMIARGRVAEADSLASALSGSTNPDSLYAAAMLEHQLDRDAVAQGLLDRVPDVYRTAPMRELAVELKTGSAIARARALAATGHKAEAVAALRQLGQTRGVSASRQAAIADALYDMGDNAGAAGLAQQALSGQIPDLAGYEAVIRVATRTGRDDLAQTAYQRAGGLAGASADGQKALARIGAAMATAQADRLRLQGQYAQAFEVLQQAWGSAPDNTDVLTALARLYQSGGMSARAAQTFQIILARAPRDRDALTGLMETAQAAGDRALSQQAQDRLVAAYPQAYETYLAVARTEQVRGNAGAATRYFKQARALYAAQAAVTPDAAFGGNPFAGANAPLGTNPFRQAAAPVPQPVNPFALGSGTRLPQAAIAPPQDFGAPASAPAAAYAPAAAPAGFGGQANFAAPAGFGGQGAGWGGPVPGAGAAQPAAMPATPVDPVLAQIETDIAALNTDSGPRAEVNASYRSRAGEVGLSQLNEVKGTVQVSTGLAGGRVYGRADAVVIDAGRPTGSGLARFGRNATIEAQAIVDKVASALVQADSQRKAGVAVAAGYSGKVVQVEGGTTPLGFEHTKATWRVAVTPQLGSNVSAHAWFERKPVADSIVSYAGTRDPVTGQFWGQVMRTGGGAGFSFDKDGSGVYGDLAYNRYRGSNVRDNHNVEANLGGYLRVMHSTHANLTAGLNINYQTYGNNQNFFTWGNGGYFSPQTFLSLGFPVNYTYESPRLDVKGSFTPGFQSFSQDRANLYPTDDAAQAQLDALKTQNSDVRNYYDSLSKTGFALSAQGAAYYRVSPSTRIGGEVSYNTFGSYDEFRSLLGIRQTLGTTR